MKPLILLAVTALCGSAYAGVYRSEDWYWSDDDALDGYYIAGTTNSAGNELGAICYTESQECLYYIGLALSCETESEYPALINSDVGAVHVSLVCIGEVEGGYGYAITPFDDINSAITQGARIGIVLPVEGDEFQVSRFSLIGSNKAVQDMKAALTRQGPTTRGTTGTRDFEVL